MIKMEKGNDICSSKYAAVYPQAHTNIKRAIRMMLRYRKYRRASRYIGGVQRVKIVNTMKNRQLSIVRCNEYSMNHSFRYQTLYQESKRRILIDKIGDLSEQISINAQPNLL